MITNKALNHQIDKIFQSHPGIYDHRNEFPWVTGSLGDPSAGAWFVGDLPCLTTLERLPGESPADLNEESQWSASRGDQLLREMLVKHGFKDGSPMAPGGWRCYLTCLVKELDYTNSLERMSPALYRQYALTWLPVFQWELSQAKPPLLVAVGGRVESALHFLARKNGLRLPRLFSISNPAYIATRSCGELGPMHPLRLQEFDEEFQQLSGFIDYLKKEKD